MEPATRADLRRSLENMLVELDRSSEAGRDQRQPVTLDQQAVGRLSRMDAIATQQMAMAQQRRDTARRARIVAALDRLETDEFGYCQRCGEQIAAPRLAIDPTVTVCVACARG